jgi:hypothetical protein
MLDFHSFQGGDVIVQSVPDFVAAWAGLVTDVLALVPEARGRLLLDIMNEPDGCARRVVALPCPRGRAQH